MSLAAQRHQLKRCLAPFQLGGGFRGQSLLAEPLTSEGGFADPSRNKPAASAAPVPPNGKAPFPLGTQPPHLELEDLGEDVGYPIGGVGQAGDVVGVLDHLGMPVAHGVTMPGPLQQFEIIQVVPESDHIVGVDPAFGADVPPTPPPC